MQLRWLYHPGRWAVVLSACSKGKAAVTALERFQHIPWVWLAAPEGTRTAPAAASVMCQVLEQGRVVAASVLDHRVPIRVAPEKQHDPSNHQGLCTDCHSIKTAEDQRKYTEFY
jgi:5-methylcytosine-specific restriction endonuclease McrA